MISLLNTLLENAKEHHGVVVAVLIGILLIGGLSGGFIIQTYELRVCPRIRSVFDGSFQPESDTLSLPETHPWNHRKELCLTCINVNARSAKTRPITPTR